MRTRQKRASATKHTFSAANVASHDCLDQFCWEDQDFRVSGCKRHWLKLNNEQRTERFLAVYGILMHARAFTSTWEYLDKLVCNSDCSRVTSSCQSSPMLRNVPDISALTTFLFLLPWTNTIPAEHSVLWNGTSCISVRHVFPMCFSI